MRILLPLAALATAAVVAGCATTGSNYVPVVDGPVRASFNADLAACQNLAAQQGAVGGQAGEQAVAGAAVAAGGTALVNNRGTNVRDAAIIGAAAGLTGGALDQQRRKEAIIRNCMRSRGHNVVG